MLAIDTLEVAMSEQSPETVPTNAGEDARSGFGFDHDDNPKGSERPEQDQDQDKVSTELQGDQTSPPDQADAGQQGQ